MHYDRVDWYSGWDIIYTFFQEISWYFEMRIIRVGRIDAAPNSIKIRSRTGHPPVLLLIKWWAHSLSKKIAEPLP